MSAHDGGSAPDRLVPGPAARDWKTARAAKARRMAELDSVADGKVVPTSRIMTALRTLVRSGDRVFVEGNNQKQADFLSRSLAAFEPGELSGLRLLLSSISRAEHVDMLESGQAERVDFAYAGPQSTRLAGLLRAGTGRIGAIHTYLELYARMFVDLVPRVALVAADEADPAGNLYTGANTEDTPTVAEATAFRDGIVIAQVNRLTTDLPRVDIPGSWVDVVVEADRPYQIEPLFTRDPQRITDSQILLAMLALRGVYERHAVRSLNHGVGFNTAAVELLLPTYGSRLGLRGEICLDWILNPHPTLIPAVESGWVRSVTAFGGEVGMRDYVAARPDVFATGPDGSPRSNRMAAQVAGHYAADMFAGSTLQIDADGNSSTVTADRLAGFGGAPNLGSDARGRRHATPTWLDLACGGEISRGRKLVVQLTETRGSRGTPRFVESLDAVQTAERTGIEPVPVMIYGDDVTHVVTEQGVAYLYRARDLTERREALAEIARATPIDAGADHERTARLRRDGLVALPADLGVDRREADRGLLAARSIDELVEWSGGLYQPPATVRTGRAK